MLHWLSFQGFRPRGTVITGRAMAHEALADRLYGRRKGDLTFLPSVPAIMGMVPPPPQSADAAAHPAAAGAPRSSLVRFLPTSTSACQDQPIGTVFILIHQHKALVNIAVHILSTRRLPLPGCTNTHG